MNKYGLYLNDSSVVCVIPGVALTRNPFFVMTLRWLHSFLTALIDTVQAFDKIEPSYLCLIYAFIWFVPLGSTVRIWHNISLKIC